VRAARVVVLLAVLALTLAVAASASSTGASVPAAGTPSIRVMFTGSASGRFNDVERWVLLSSGECYLRRMRDQKTSLTWSLTFSGGRALSAASAQAVTGAVAGTEVKDSCDDVAEELPPDAPDDWLQSRTCNDTLNAIRPGRASWVNGVLRLNAPVVAVAKDAVCSVRPRSEELNARLPLPVARISSLKRGASIRIPVGSNRPATGTYRTKANCLHPAKPYDGYRSFDECVDILSWTGTVTVTRQ
jgi:hypothetical protein